jgi:protein-serine/threonine kinase
MAVSVLAAAATQTSSLGIFTLFNLSHERLPLAPFSPSNAVSYKASPPSAATQTQVQQQPVAGGSSVAPSSTAVPVPIAKAAPHPNHQTSSNFSSLSSSPRQFPTDLTGSILEEGDETESEPSNEPVTPVSGRQSQDFHTLANSDVHPEAIHGSLATDQEATSFSNVRTTSSPASKPNLALNTNATPQKQRQQQQPESAVSLTPIASTQSAEQDQPPLSRRSTRGSTSNFKRSMTNLFKRTPSAADRAALGETSQSALASDVNLPGTSNRKTPSRRWSMNKSSATTRSNTPPSPSSPLEMAVKTKEQASMPTVPTSEVFFEGKKKARAATGFSLRARVANVNNKKQQPPIRRRASSFDYSNQQKPETGNTNEPVLERALWGLPAATGTGVKARRMSLSLPDDFTVDVAELSDEFEYLHKFLGRHGKHLGKGATSKVTLMVRKGSPGELYAVKEFRGKSSNETREEYEKKIKSEYTLAKSLHHPNIVETVRLCTSHGRWNHVMEYCQEGDLFGLVNKKFLTTEEREKDRQCLFKQLVQGINYLHANGIAHRDIKLENLLITSDSKLKITDFGVSEVFCGIHPGLREAGGQCGTSMGAVRRCAPGICGSEPYIAPEVLTKGSDYDPRALDVWSSAIVMLNLIFGAPLWRRAEVAGNPNYAALVTAWERWMAKNENDETRIAEGCYPYVKAFDLCVKPPALRRILLQMLHPNPDKRITIADVVKNRWVKGIECCQLESYDDPSRTIDASKKASLKCGGSKTYCHSHLPPKESNTHSLGKMPGQAGY